MKTTIIALIGLVLFASCKKTKNETVSIINLVVTTANGTVISANGVYNTTAGKFEMRYSGKTTVECGWNLDMTYHDGNNTRLPATGRGDQLGTTAQLTNGSFTVDLTGCPMNYLVQVNATFTPIMRSGQTFIKGHDQITFFVRRTN